ncbi:hypothetical protein LSH36_396g03020 [Paralvinella palmiformis]|uniref:Major facilitator superfamily (MFS) profile domain-containing protein n=1 Tax=Paralvinella palmiformis TaxID=53620 RepID=A0AAD9JCK1_9ANNE|nr:hypothetical protein LSH36_396g03020 [Paralvinella palmiformis]
MVLIVNVYCVVTESPPQSLAQWHTLSAYREPPTSGFDSHVTGRFLCCLINSWSKMAKPEFEERLKESCLLFRQNKYAIYVLTMLTVVYMVNQCDTFCLIATNTSMSQELQYGDRQCSSYNDTAIVVMKASNMITRLFVIGDIWVKVWSTSFLPVHSYIVLFSISGIPMGLSAELKNLNRKLMLFIFAIFWSAMTILGGFCNQYWQVALSRLLLGIFSAACVPFCASIISDYFKPETRGAALGFFNWGVYVGYSVTFLLTIAEQELGWRSVYFLAGAPGIILSVFVMTTVREPARNPSGEIKGTLAKLKNAATNFTDPCLLLLCLGGAVRNGAGLVFAYNIIIFFDEYHPGVNILSAPFLVGTLYAPMPWCWICQMVAYVIGEMWIGVCVAVVIDLVPSDLTASAVAVYFFIIQIIGGNMNLLVPPIEHQLGLRYALLITFPAMYLLAALLFTITLAVYVRSKRSKEKAHESGGHLVARRSTIPDCEPHLARIVNGDVSDVVFTQSSDLLREDDILARSHALMLESAEQTTQL